MSRPTMTLQTERDQTIDALCQGFASDAISMAELDRRLARARAARTRGELRELLSDLKPSTAVPATKGEAGTSRAAAGRGREGVGRPRQPVKDVPGEALPEVRPSSHLAFAVLGGTRRAGRWVPPADMVAVAIMGGIELDFRDAVLQAGVTDIYVFAFWGGVEITVPPDVHVDTRGFALLGGFEQTAELESNPPPGAPVIRVNGLALMGGVDVKVKSSSGKAG